MTISDKLRGFIAEELVNVPAEDLADDYPIRESLDSVGLVELVSFIESEFDVEIPNEDLLPDNFSSIGSISKLVEGHLANA